MPSRDGEKRLIEPVLLEKPLQNLRRPKTLPYEILTLSTPPRRCEAQMAGLSPNELVALSWIKDADCVLLCAGAGMSANTGYNVYVSKEDFAKFYPYMAQWGYHTGYECMGLRDDPSVPQDVKSAFLIHHISNMRYVFPLNDGYPALLDLLQREKKDYFIWTSNVDGCFQRAGFDPEKIYEPQGDYGFLQCRPSPCCRKVYDAKPYIDRLLPKILANNGRLAKEDIPMCPNCNQKPLFGNVRGGDWFIHDHFNPSQDRLISWLNNIDAKKLKLAIIEVGAGFNTPVVTRFPMEAMARTYKASSLIRINPSDPDVPLDLPRAVGLPVGWQALVSFNQALKTSLAIDPATLASALQSLEGDRSRMIDEIEEENGGPVDHSNGIRPMMHFAFLKSLRR